MHPLLLAGHAISVSPVFLSLALSMGSANEVDSLRLSGFARSKRSLVGLASREFGIGFSRSRGMEALYVVLDARAKTLRRKGS